MDVIFVLGKLSMKDYALIDRERQYDLLKTCRVEGCGGLNTNDVTERGDNLEMSTFNCQCLV